MSRPLEDRFPTLYHDIVHESPAAAKDGSVGPAKEKRTPKANEPTLHQVIEAVCSTHRVTDLGLMKDLTATVSEFLGLRKAKAAVASGEEEEEEAPKRKRA